MWSVSLAACTGASSIDLIRRKVNFTAEQMTKSDFTVSMMHAELDQMRDENASKAELPSEANFCTPL